MHSTYFGHTVKKIKHHKLVLSVIFILLALGFVIYLYVFRPLYALYEEVEGGKALAAELQSAISDRDLGRVSEGLEEAGVLIDRVGVKLDDIAYLGNLPFASSYYQDALNGFQGIVILHGTVQAALNEISPYAEVLGLQSVQDDSAQVEEKGLKEFIKLAPQLLPVFDIVADGVEDALPYLLAIQPEQYPNLDGLPIRDLLFQAHDGALMVDENLEQVREIVHILPSLLGEPDPQNYLVLFQNDKELRPTGGFITSYAIVTLKSAEVSISDAKNIYEVSSEETYLPPPQPIVTYLKQPLWRMRDTNFSPDFKESMETFLFYWDSLGLTEVTGVVALDTQFVASLLESLGPVEIEDYSYDFAGFPNLPDDCKIGGTSFTHENVVCRLEVYAQQLGLDQFQRKAVIGDLMEKIFERIMSLSSDEWQPLVLEVMGQLDEKHILAHLRDDAAQSILEEYNWAGRIDSEHQGDYLHVNDSNLAGLKSDMYLKRSATQFVEIDADGSITKKVKLIYENTGSFDGWLNATARNYVRLYVPEGSELIEVTGGEVQTTTANELGKTVFDNFVLIPPLTTSEIEFVYKLPFKYSGAFDMLIQKQPGVPVVYHTLEYQGAVSEFELRTDTVRKL